MAVPPMLSKISIVVPNVIVYILPLVVPVPTCALIWRVW